MAIPRLVYDDDCGFCKWCIRWFLRFGEFDPVGFEALSPDQKARLPDDYDRCMHLLTDDAVYSCGEALEQSLARCGRVGGAIISVCQHIPGWDTIRERGYRWVADRRAVWGRVRSCETVDDG
jgi:predicted DCC family thiol-disulfide oxidoreductase YuxK